MMLNCKKCKNDLDMHSINNGYFFCKLCQIKKRKYKKKKQYPKPVMIVDMAIAKPTLVHRLRNGTIRFLDRIAQSLFRIGE